MIWLLKKTFFRSFSVGTWLSLLGLILGVACLFMAMSVFNGFEYGLRQSIVNVFGHVTTGGLSFIDSREEKKIKAWVEDLPQEAAPYDQQEFLHLESLLLKGKVLSGTLLQAYHWKKTLPMNHYLVEGKPEDLLNYKKGVWVGKGLAKKHNLSNGSSLRLVFPSFQKFSSRKVQEFLVVGIIDLGKHEYNERMVLTHLPHLRELLGINNKVSGWNFRFEKEKQGEAFGYFWKEKWGEEYWSLSWKDRNYSFFEAVKVEKLTLFFVLFIMILVAAVSLSSSLYIDIFKNYSFFSLLKTVGTSSWLLYQLILLRVFFLGFCGLLLGHLLGWGGVQFFSYLQKQYSLLPGDIYLLDQFVGRVLLRDIVYLSSFTFFILLVTAWFPSRKLSKIKIVEGLKYH